MTMPFGRHKGWPLPDLPDSYVQWLFDCDWIHEPLRSAVDQEWMRRFHRLHNEPEEDNDSVNLGSLEPEDRVLLNELIRAGYRALAQKYHPDHNGQHEVMIRLT